MVWCTLLFFGGGVPTGLDAQVIQGRILDVRTRRNNRPVPIVLNGTYVRVRRNEVMTLDEIIALGQVGAIEVYWRHAPAEYGAGAAIVIWTR